MYYSQPYLSPIGPLLLVCDDTHLVGLWMEGQKYFARTVDASPLVESPRPLLKQASAWLDAYFRGEDPDAGLLPLAPRGTAFQQAVWRQLLRIPRGETMTYGAIGKQVALDLNKPTMAGQAIGGAVGHNPLSIIIPCHRVVGGNRSLTGYAGGLAKKIHLLEHEGVDTCRFSVPTKGTAL